MEDFLRQQNRERQAKQISVNTLKESFTDTKFEISSLSQRLRIEFEVNVNDILNIEPKGLGSMEELIPQVEKMKVKFLTYR